MFSDFNRNRSTISTISRRKFRDSQRFSSSNTLSRNSSSELHRNPFTPVSKEDDYDAALVLASIRNVTKVESVVATYRKPMCMPSIPDLECYFQRARENPRVPKLNTAPEVSEGAARIRAVSLEVQSRAAGPHKKLVAPHQDMVVISPPSSPNINSSTDDHHVSRSPRNVDRRKRYLDDRRLSAEFSLPAQLLQSPKISFKKTKSSDFKTYSATSSTTETTLSGIKNTVLRKKFSWKSCPELENFLIQNREEYLHYSALNYTIQQKQYNNNLTQSLIDLASKTGYTFDPAEFNFVQVRDRIRCYFKSYVQSRKKRGIAIRPKKT